MTSFLRVPAGVLIAATLLGTAACSSTPVYPHDQACSLGTEVVSKLMSSDRFTADEQELTGLPISRHSGHSICSADRGENRLIVSADIIVGDELEYDAGQTGEEKNQFTYRGGSGFWRDDVIRWTCGNVRVRISVREVPDDEVDWKRLGEPLWDQVGCLTVTGPDEASQPEGWN